MSSDSDPFGAMTYEASDGPTHDPSARSTKSRKQRRRAKSTDSARTEKVFPWSTKLNSDESKNAFRKYLDDNTATFASMDPDTMQYSRRALSKAFPGAFERGGDFDRSKVDKSSVRDLRDLISSLKSGTAQSDPETSAWYTNELNSRLSASPSWNASSTPGHRTKKPKRSAMKSGRERSTDAMTAETLASEMNSETESQSQGQRRRRKKRGGRGGENTEASGESSRARESRRARDSEQDEGSELGRSSQSGRSRSRSRRRRDDGTTAQDSEAQTGSTRSTKKKGGKRRKGDRGESRTGDDTERSTGRSRSRRDNSEAGEDSESRDRHRSSRSKKSRKGRGDRVRDTEEQVTSKREARRKRKEARESDFSQDTTDFAPSELPHGFALDPATQQSLQNNWGASYTGTNATSQPWLHTMGSIAPSTMLQPMTSTMPATSAFNPGMMPTQTSASFVPSMMSAGTGINTTQAPYWHKLTRPDGTVVVEKGEMTTDGFLEIKEYEPSSIPSASMVRAY